MPRIWFFSWNDVIEIRSNRTIHNPEWLQEFIISRHKASEPVFVLTHKCRDYYDELRDKSKLKSIILDGTPAEEKMNFNLDDYVRIAYANDPVLSSVSEAKVNPCGAEAIGGKNLLIRYTLQKYGIKIPDDDFKNIVLFDYDRSNCQNAHEAGFSVIHVDGTSSYITKAKSFAEGNPVPYSPAPEVLHYATCRKEQLEPRPPAWSCVIL